MRGVIAGCLAVILAVSLTFTAAAQIPAVARDSTAIVDSLSLDSLLNTEIARTAKYNESVNDGSAPVMAASKYKQSSDEAPASITIVTSDEIRMHGYQTLAEVLQMVPGFYTSNDRTYSYLGVRGYSRPTDFNNRVVLLLNGHSMNENVYGSALIGTEMGLDLGHVERIEIVRGPGSALYGTNAMLAVINIVTKAGGAIDGGNAHIEAGSYGHFGGGIAAGQHIDNGIDWSVSGQWTNIAGQQLYFPEYDDPATNHGFSDRHDDQDQDFGFIGVGQYKHATIQASLSERTKAVPTGSYDTDFNVDGARAKDLRSMLELKLNLPWGDNRVVMGRLYYDAYRFDGQYPYEIDQHDRTHGDWVGGEAQLAWDLRVDNRLILGVEHQNHVRADYTQWDADTVYFDGDFPFTVWSAYAQDEARLSRALSVTAGIRFDYNSTIGSLLSPRGAIVFSPPVVGTFKLLLGGAFRAPNVFEREIGGGETVQGNPNLQPEKIQTYELTWDYRIRRGLRGALSLYRFKMSDLIDPSVDPVDSLTMYVNVSGASARGIGLELEQRSGMGTSLLVSYSYQKTTDSETDADLTNSPQHSAKLVGVLPVGPHLTLGGRGLYESRRLTVYDTWTKPYVIAGFTVTLRPRLLPATSRNSILSRSSLALTVNNAFNKAYQIPGGLEHRQTAFTQDGRHMLLKLRFEF